MRIYKNRLDLPRPVCFTGIHRKFMEITGNSIAGYGNFFRHSGSGFISPGFFGRDAVSGAEKKSLSDNFSGEINVMGLYRPPLAPALPPIGGMAHAMPWNYLYFRHSKLTSSNSVIAIWGRHGGRGESKKSVRIVRRISHENCIKQR